MDVASFIVSHEAICMRVVEWNVAKALGHEAHLVADLKPSIAILPESAHPDRTGQSLKAIGATSVQGVAPARTRDC